MEILLIWGFVFGVTALTIKGVETEKKTEQKQELIKENNVNTERKN